jgi:hypothetical protein
LQHDNGNQYLLIEGKLGTLKLGLGAEEALEIFKQNQHVSFFQVKIIHNRYIHTVGIQSELTNIVNLKTRKEGRFFFVGGGGAIKK